MNEGVTYYFKPSGQILRTGHFWHFNPAVGEGRGEWEGSGWISQPQFLCMQNQGILLLQCCCEAIKFPLTDSVAASILASFLLGKSINFILLEFPQNYLDKSHSCFLNLQPLKTHQSPNSIFFPFVRIWLSVVTGKIRNYLTHVFIAWNSIFSPFLCSDRTYRHNCCFQLFFPLPSGCCDGLCGTDLSASFSRYHLCETKLFLY